VPEDTDSRPRRYGRPRAQMWEKQLEQGMERPQQEDIFSLE
jgi:hypothetical protein